VSRVLFVDDDLQALERLQAAFEDQEWDMRFMGSARAALESMEREPTDVVVSDFLMPEMSGIELLAEIRRRHPDTVRLLLLGEDDERGLVEGAAVAHQFLAKPGPLDKLVGAVDSALRLRQELKGERVRAEMSGIDALLSPQGVFGELMDVLQSPGGDAASIARVLERDVALSAKVLQLANASFFAPRKRVTSVQVAVARLGTQTIRSLALMDGLIRGCDAHDKVLRSWLVRFNIHATETARLAERLAGSTARSDAFCAGLLHDCGQLVFATCRPEVFSAHLRLQDVEARLLVELEEETFGVTHAQAGAYLLSLWGLPLDVIRAASIHTTPVHLGGASQLSASAAAQLAHHLVEAEVLPLCSTPGTPGPDDTTLQEAGVLGEVWAWRAERAADSDYP
jgi:HD-like signal output (HDOD) protein/CheY-like chemotaxis protein